MKHCPYCAEEIYVVQRVARPASPPPTPAPAAGRRPPPPAGRRTEGPPRLDHSAFAVAVSFANASRAFLAGQTGDWSKESKP